MRIHHDKHHQAYVDNANKALDGTEWADRPVEAVLAQLDVVPRGQAHRRAQQRRRACQPLALLADHVADGGGAPSGALGAAIDDAFGSFDAFKEQFAAAAWAGSAPAGPGSSGTARGSRSIDAEPGQPDHGRRRAAARASTSGSTPTTSTTRTAAPDYVAAFWNVVDWDEVGRRFEAARAS